jgi:hypothetical protein
MLKKILLAVLGVVVAILGYAWFRSPDMAISRELLIAASAETIFPFINDSQKANGWMPWTESDPGVKMVYSGPSAGVGSKSSWDSQGQMGTGEAVVIESIPNQSVKTQLTYTKPMAMSQLAEVSLSSQGDGTLVRWSVSGKMGFFFRLMGVFVNCDKMIGAEFEKGLANLKKQVESLPH